MGENNIVFDKYSFSSKTNKTLNEIERFHNHSIYQEIKIRNNNNMNSEAIWYKKTSISYKEMFIKADIYANALKKMGIKKGDEIPVCMSNIPQFIYLFLAISKLGAIINSIGDWFDDDYIELIFKEAKSNIFFCSEDVEKRFQSVNEKIRKTVVSFSLDDKSESELKFEELGKSKLEDLKIDVSLEDIFTITYTSGTTNPGRPKAVKHKNLCYMILARYKDADVSGMPSMKKTRIFSHIPMYVHASLSTSVVDPLFQECSIVLEPEYDVNRFPYAILEGKPNQVCASVGFWLKLAWMLENSLDFRDADLSFLYVPTVTGEGMSIGEERYLNSIAKKYKFGSGKIPFNLTPVTFSIGGGTSESSGVLVTLFKCMQEKRFKYRRWKSLGLKVLDCAKVCVLNEQEKEVKNGENGTAWFLGPCNMVGYHYDNGKTEKYAIHDGLGRTWIKMNALVTKQDERHLIIRGREDNFLLDVNGNKKNFYEIEEYLYIHNPELMSLSIVNITEADVVFHIESRLDSKLSEDEIIKKVEDCIKILGLLRKDKNIYVRVRTHNESFLIAPSGKRDINALQKEGTSKAVLCGNRL